MFTLLGCAVLMAAILGSSYTGLSGDWLTADVVLGGEIYLATVGLTDVRLQNERGSQKYSFPYFQRNSKEGPGSGEKGGVPLGCVECLDGARYSISLKGLKAFNDY